MSWSVSAIGSKSEVQNALDAQFKSSQCSAEKEETLRLSAQKLISTAINASSDDVELTVSAFGSQSTIDGGTDTERVANSIRINVQAVIR